jgi:hypothetical protein
MSHVERSRETFLRVLRPYGGIAFSPWPPAESVVLNIVIFIHSRHPATQLQMPREQWKNNCRPALVYKC